MTLILLLLRPAERNDARCMIPRHFHGTPPSGGGTVPRALQSHNGVSGAHTRCDEISLDDRMWTIPATRTKTGVEHRIPLSGRALAVLHEARELSDGSRLVFVNHGRKLGKSAFSMLLRRHGIPCTAHGFRSSFRDWTAVTGVRREVAEAYLAHVVKGVEASYLRTRLYSQRVTVMQDYWVAQKNGYYPRTRASARPAGRPATARGRSAAPTWPSAGSVRSSAPGAGRGAGDKRLVRGGASFAREAG